MYDTGRRTVARWPHNRPQKLEVDSYGEINPDPPKNRKKKVCLKMHFRPFPVFLAYVFLSGKSADPNPAPPS